MVKVGAILKHFGHLVKKKIVFLPEQFLKMTKTTYFFALDITQT